MLYGSARGLTVTGNQLWSAQTSGGVAWRPEKFGQALAAGDFDADGYRDLAVIGWREFQPKPEDDWDHRGSVFLLKGSATGLVGGGAIEDVTLSGLSHEVAMAAGDFNADGAADLAIGEPGVMVRRPRLGRGGLRAARLARVRSLRGGPAMGPGGRRCARSRGQRGQFRRGTRRR